ncbi:MAG: hypothetical protein ACOC9Y_06745 [Chloroflexota bacterium]
MNLKRPFLIAGLGVLVLIGGCVESTSPETGSGASSDAETTQGAEDIPEASPTSEPLIAGDVEPIEFTELASEDERPSLPYRMQPPVVHLATEQDEMDLAWAMHRLTGEPAELDWSRSAALYFALSESSSCPWKVVGVSAGEDEIIGRLDYDMDIPDGADEIDCNSDDNPRTFVVEVDREDIHTQETTVRFLHDRWDIFAMRTDERNVALRHIDDTDLAYPFTVWQSEDPNGRDDSPRVVESAEWIAEDDSTMVLRLGFPEMDVVPDASSGDGFELIDEDYSGVQRRLGLTVNDAALGFSPPVRPVIYAAERGVIAAPGRDYHPMMATGDVYLFHRSTEGPIDPQFAVNIDTRERDVEFEVRNGDDDPTLELVISEVESGTS